MLEIEQVSFAYPGQPPALKNVSAVVREGEFIGLAGRNGSGKNDIDPHHGRIGKTKGRPGHAGRQADEKLRS